MEWWQHVLMVMWLYVGIKWLYHLPVLLSAEKAFRRLHPKTPINWSVVFAVKSGEWMVHIFYGGGNPPRRQRYQVATYCAAAQQVEAGF